MTADFVYIRFHGPLKEAYRSAYPDEFLEEWAGKIRSWMKAVNAIYIYFDNPAEGQAAVDAMKMQLLLEQVANPEAPLEGTESSRT